jgi:hypothetical protein
MVTTVRRSLPARAWARVFLTSVALIGLGAAPATADIAYGITTGHLVFTFDTSAPTVEISHRVINLQKLQPGESELAMDLRPSTGQIYFLGSSSRLYVFDPSDGIPRALSAAPFTPALSGTSFALDVDPTTDTIRVISDTGQNLRLDPETGMVIAVDTPLNPGAPHVVGAAYANNHAGSSSTALYVIDSNSDQLLVSSAPNGGTLVPVGPLGVDTTDDVGFDITANDGVGFATLTTGGVSRLYTINLSTGAATLVQSVISGNIRSFTVLKRGVPMLSLRNGTELIRFHSANPAALLGTVAITGLQAGETLVGIDRRPSNGQVYGVGSNAVMTYLVPKFFVKRPTATSPPGK